MLRDRLKKLETLLREAKKMAPVKEEKAMPGLKEEMNNFIMSDKDTLRLSCLIADYLHGPNKNKVIAACLCDFLEHRFWSFKGEPGLEFKHDCDHCECLIGCPISSNKCINNI